MKLNNKGLSLVELIISVALISVVVVFMYRLLLTINNEITNTTFAINNQQNRIEIIKTIENDLLQNTVTKIEQTSALPPTIKITYLNNKFSTITFSRQQGSSLDDTLKYTDVNGTPHTWIIKDKGAYFNVDNIEITRTVINNAGDTYRIFIMVNNQNDNNSPEKNNILDDIDLNYFGTNL